MDRMMSGPVESQKKKSKILSWLRIPGFMQKSQGRISKDIECCDKSNKASTMPGQSFSNNIINTPQCCCECISKQMYALNICHSGSHCNSSRSMCQYHAIANECPSCNLVNEHASYKKPKKEHLHSLAENKENVPCSLHEVRSSYCKNSLQGYCQKHFKPKIYSCDCSSCKVRHGCSNCSQGVWLAPKCLMRQGRSQDTNKEGTNIHHSKYRSVGVNTTPQQITTAAEINVCAMKDYAHSFPNARVLECSEHLKERRCKSRNYHIENEYMKPVEKLKRREGLSQIREDYIQNDNEYLKSVHRCKRREGISQVKEDCVPDGVKFGHSKLTTDRMMNGPVELHKRKQLLCSERVLKSRLRYANRTIPKSWKHKSSLKDDDSKSSFADDEKSELDSSGGANHNHLKHTCL